MKKVDISYQRNIIGSNQATFYDPKYKLIVDGDNVNVIKGFLGNDDGRLITILFFENDLCVINIHPGHYGSNTIQNLDKSIEDIMEERYRYNEFYREKDELINTNLSVNQKNEIKRRLANYDIILMGDFNSNLDFNNYNYNKFFTSNYFAKTRTFYGRNKTPSCCSTSLNSNSNNINKAYDHILFTSDNVKSTVHKINNASDHLPIIAEINIPNKPNNPQYHNKPNKPQRLNINNVPNDIEILLNKYINDKSKLGNYNKNISDYVVFDINNMITSLKEMVVSADYNLQKMNFEQNK